MKPEYADQLTPENVLYGLLFLVGGLVAFWQRQHRRNRRRRRYVGQGPRRVPQTMRMQVWRRDGPNCYLCGNRYGPVHLKCTQRHLLFFTTRGNCSRCYQCDHVHPYSKGGITHPSNLRVAHAGCNRRKSDRVLRSRL